jgi:hypothetical protein
MAWNYSHNPSNSAKDEVRFLIGDTNERDPLLHDEEILYLLKLYNQYPLNSAARGCEMIIAKFSRLADETVGSVSKSFRALMLDLRLRIGLEGAKPYAGGISALDKQANVEDSDKVKATFTKHQFENKQVAPWTSQSQLEEFKDNQL